MAGLLFHNSDMMVCTIHCRTHHYNKLIHTNIFLRDASHESPSYQAASITWSHHETSHFCINCTSPFPPEQVLSYTCGHPTDLWHCHSSLIWFVSDSHHRKVDNFTWAPVSFWSHCHFKHLSPASDNTHLSALLAMHDTEFLGTFSFRDLMLQNLLPCCHTTASGLSISLICTLPGIINDSWLVKYILLLFYNYV